MYLPVHFRNILPFTFVKIACTNSKYTIGEHLFLHREGTENYTPQKVGVIKTASPSPNDRSRRKQVNVYTHPSIKLF